MSLRAYARHRGCQLKAVQDAIRDGRLRKSLTVDKKITSAEDADAEWAATTLTNRIPLTGPAAKGGQAPDLADSRARREAAEAELAEIKLAEMKGELIRAETVEARVVEDYSRCRTKLLGVPSRARQRDPGLTQAQIGLIEELVREALDDLAAGDEAA